jgi:heme A synthase
MRPGPHARYREDQTVEFPPSARLRFDDRVTRHRLFPRMRAHAGAPAPALRSYASAVHTSRPLVAFASLFALLALILGARRRDPRTAAVFLPWSVALLMLLGAAATAGFALRYLVPLVAEFAMAATLSLELVASPGGRGRRVVHSASRTAVEP